VIVVDTNVIAYLLIVGDHTVEAKAVLRKDSDWAAPFLWRSEFCSVLTLYIRQEHLSLSQAQRFMQEAEYLMQGGEHQVSSSHVLNLATISSCSAYDCEFVALAQQLTVPLVTSDNKILSEFPSIAISMSQFISS
jgi:predicted nucleic acid-binding protein